MTSLIEAIKEGEEGSGKNPGFPHAPDDWTLELALKTAQQEGLEMVEERWEVVRALQDFYLRHTDGSINLRELHDALDERFHSQGGIKYLYQIFPGGPVSQGCRIAGLRAPAGAADTGFGSVS